MIIQTKDLVKRYKGKIVLNHMNLEVNEGEIFGLLGPNGSGKTSFINCLLGLTTYDGGQIKLFNREMNRKDVEIKRQIGVVMQEIGVYEELTVYENIDYFCGLYVQDCNKRMELVEEAIELVKLQDYIGAYPKTLSGGLLRRLNIACGIAHQPKLIILDEPTLAIDVNMRHVILEGLKKLNQKGSTILYTSHYMEEIEMICSQIGIMSQGKVIARGSKEALLGMISAGETIKIEIVELPDEIKQGIRELPHVECISYEGNILEVKYRRGQNNLRLLLDYLDQEKIQLGNIEDKMPNLNDVFLELTGRELMR
ncbi:MAG: ABC transporter ATP-binding protein [Cellulosilyticum sp.]|nr:ABC transporter ATP-binding protein [Cellulosilyticum sp.]